MIKFTTSVLSLALLGTLCFAATTTLILAVMAGVSLLVTGECLFK